MTVPDASRRSARRRRWLGPLLVGTATLLAACQPAARTITVPISSWPGFEYLGLAADLAVDQRHGLDLEVVQFADPQEIVHAYLRGEQPIAPLTTVEAVDLCERVPNRCPVVVLVLDESRGGDQLAVHNAVSSIADLRGRTVAVTFSTLGPYVVDRALAKQGLHIGDVTLRNMPLDRMADALARAEVAAAALFSPYSERALRDGHSRMLFTSREIPGEIFDVLVVDPHYLKAHAKEVALLVHSWQGAHQFAQRDPKRAVALMARREQVSEEAFKASEEGLVYFPLAEQVAMLEPGGVIAQSLRRVHALQQHLGLSGGDAPLPHTTDAAVKQAMQLP